MAGARLQVSESTPVIVTFAKPEGVLAELEGPVSETLTLHVEISLTRTSEQLTLVKVGRRRTSTVVTADDDECTVEFVQGKETPVPGPAKATAVTVYEPDEPGPLGAGTVSVMLKVPPAMSGIDEAILDKHTTPGDADATDQGELGRTVALTLKVLPQLPEKVSDTEEAA